jgi:hypothetical protein
MKKTREDWLEGRQPSSPYPAEEKLWCKMWKVEVQSKIHIFLWSMETSSSEHSTGAIRHHRNMASAAFHNWRHSLLDWTMAHSVWDLQDEDMVEYILINQCCNAK